ncbi:MAG: putative transcriptional regulator, MarR family [Acidimicrobiaceae bacterium]|nr:putative transcriptional regulator, MarR family [Acidimicrobiaceae bacterium]
MTGKDEPQAVEQEERAIALEDAWRELEALHASVSESLERDLQRQHGIGRHEYEVLVHLTSDRCRISDVALDVHISQSAASRLIDRLEELGLACRENCSDDRRGVFACATDEGRSRVEKARATEQAVLERFLLADAGDPAMRSAGSGARGTRERSSRR